METNRYAASNVATTPRARPWTPTTEEEMRAFIGMLIIMGVLKSPRLEMYWTQKWPEIATPGISSIMPLRRFEQIFRFFHLTNNENQIPFGQPGHDTLYKVRELLDVVSPRFDEEYTIHQQCTIDEAMIPSPVFQTIYEG